ncbi:hypothetical protein MTF65_09705 [Streptomyces sp. APSN-46.1]|uniref:hypothetical protein n=1 Tax=Streptomyces sp. APSN-46.1 TaxID=2929049 RepID=UPI001FB543D8|nr:hypothetical protein [Streptomyces sp. APSN-46.1]MCJ1677606.1 hypothetical protein [Streptomyces sp. APSN-46.1]
MNTTAPSAATSTSPGTSYATAQRPVGTRPWLLVPALVTALTLLAAGLSYSASYLPEAPLWLSVPYLIPLALAAATWRRPRTPDQRANRIALGGLGCALALFYAKAAEAVLCVVVIALWLIQGD